MTTQKVLFLISDLAFGGVERVSLNLIRKLPTTLFKCDVFACGNATDLESEVPEGVHYYPGVDSALRMRQAFPTLVRKLREIIHSYDVVIATSPSTTALMHVAGIGHVIRKMSWIHFNAEAFLPNTTGLIRIISRIFYPLTQERIFISEGVKRSFYKCFGAQVKDRVIYNLLDPNAYLHPSTTEEKIKEFKNDKPVLGFVGRLAEQKGLPELLLIHENLLERGFQHILAIIGEGPLRLQLEEEVKARGLQGSVHLLGADPCPVQAMRHMDLLLVTSEHEAWPTVILEGFHVGTPVVSFACPSGPSEMLTGILRYGLVNERSIEQFATTILEVLPRREELVKAGKERLAQFAPEEISTHWIQLLQ